MSTASISRSPYETAPPARREPAKARGTDEVFTLPAAEKREANDTTNRPRPRVEQGRGAGEAPARGREGGGSKETIDTTSPGGAEKAEGGDKTTEVAKAGEALVEAGKQGAGDAVAEAAAPAEKPATGEEMIALLPQPVPLVAPAEASKSALEAPLEGAAQPAPDAVAATVETPPEAAKPATGPSEIATQFLALVAATQQPGVEAEPEGVADKEAGAVPDGKAQTVSALPAAAVLAPAPAPPVKVEGEASVGAEVVAGEAKAVVKPAVAGAMLPAEATKAAPETTDEAGTGQTSTATASAEGKAAERPASAGQVPAASDGGKADAPQQAAPSVLQAIPAVSPQVQGKPELPPTPLDAAAQANAQAQAEANARAPVETTRPTPLHVVPVEIGARALAGNKRFDIRLDPAELGRVDVRLEISDKGEVSAKLTVDRVETLHLLQRDARTLERAFEQAGLKPSDGGVEMSLRDSADQSSRQQRQDDEGARTRRTWVETAEDGAPITETAPRRAARLGGVDLSI